MAFDKAKAYLESHGLADTDTRIKNHAAPPIHSSTVPLNASTSGRNLPAT